MTCCWDWIQWMNAARVLVSGYFVEHVSLIMLAGDDVRDRRLAHAIDGLVMQMIERRRETEESFDGS